MGSDTAPLRRGRNTGDDGHFQPMQIDRNSSSASDGRLDLWSGELMRCKKVIKWDSVASQGREVCAPETHTACIKRKIWTYRGDARGEERSLSDETEESIRVGCLYSSIFSVSSDSFT